MVRVDERAVAENRGPLQHVAKLPNISGPVIVEQGLSSVARQTSGRPPERLANLLQKRLAERQDVRRTVA